MIEHISLFWADAKSYSKRLNHLSSICCIELPFIEDDTNKSSINFLNCVSSIKAGTKSNVISVRKELYEVFKKALPDLSLLNIFHSCKEFDNTPEAIIQVYEKEKGAYPGTIIEYMDSLLNAKEFVIFNKWLLFICCFPIIEPDDASDYLKLINNKLTEKKENDNEAEREKSKLSQKKEYIILYPSFSKYSRSNFIRSLLTIDERGNAQFIVNVRENGTGEYSYTGNVIEKNSNIYIALSNKHSDETIWMNMIKSAGNLERYIGIMSANSSVMAPCSFKFVCVSKQLENSINMDLLRTVLSNNNKEYSGDLLILENWQQSLFFSDNILIETD